MPFTAQTFWAEWPTASYAVFPFRRDPNRTNVPENHLRLFVVVVKIRWASKKITFFRAIFHVLHEFQTAILGEMFNDIQRDAGVKLTRLKNAGTIRGRRPESDDRGCFAVRLLQNQADNLKTGRVRSAQFAELA